MFSPPFLGNSLVAANMIIQSAEASRVEMKVDGGVIDEQPNSQSLGLNVIKVGPESTLLKCPQCKCIVHTRIEHESSMQTHVVAAMLMPACCCVPYCFDCFKNVHHYCPGCGQYLDTFRR